MKDTKTVLQELGWSESLIAAILTEQDSPEPAVTDPVQQIVVSSSDVLPDSIELTLSGGDGIVYKV